MAVVGVIVFVAYKVQWYPILSIYGTDIIDWWPLVEKEDRCYLHLPARELCREDKSGCVSSRPECTFDGNISCIENSPPNLRFLSPSRWSRWCSQYRPWDRCPWHPSCQHSSGSLISMWVGHQGHYKLTWRWIRLSIWSNQESHRFEQPGSQWRRYVCKVSCACGNRNRCSELSLMWSRCTVILWSE